jgi:hypothetical protein
MSGGRPNSLERGLSAAAVLSALTPLIVALRTNINWDEFRFLSHVYQFEQGRLARVFQTGYVHVFSWLPQTGGFEVDQIVLARALYFVFQLISAVCLYRIARGFVSRSASWVVLMSFFWFSNLMVHGASFRADGLALFLYMMCLALLLGAPGSRKSIPLAGGLFGMAIFVTLKAVLLGLSLIPLLLLGLGRADRGWAGRLQDAALFGISAGVAGTMAFLMHLGSLPGAESPAGRILAAGDKTIFSAGFLPQLPWLVLTVWQNPTTWFLLISGLGIVLLRIARRSDRRRSLQVLSLFLPLLSIFFYRNSFPYFYVLILPPALVLVGITFDTLTSAVRRWPAVALILPLLIVVDSIPIFSFRSKDTLTRQREIVEVVHRMYRHPVPYIDGVSMIASFPKVGFFMSSWGMENYLSPGRPMFRELVQAERPQFLLANASELEVFGRVHTKGNSGRELLPDDREFLRNQFVHHWGPIYVPGTEVRLADDEIMQWETLIPGAYTVESDSLLIDDELQRPGSLVYLKSGVHQISAAGDKATAVLRWGSNLYRPDNSPPDTPIFIGI